MTSNTFILSDGEEIPLIFEIRRDARNITLRPKTTPKREIHVSKPRWTPVFVALNFLEQKRNWIEKFFKNAPKKIKLQDGDTIVIFGEKMIISQKELGGRPEFFERRLRDKIKEMFLARAKAIIKEVPKEFRPIKITVRDTSSRWGSCSTSGTISLSWRLAFAPPEIMRYVIIHELAHIKHMDHSPAFWAQVSKLYGEGVGRAKLWLSKNGAELYKYF
ncbi:MAG: M48 family metallopeptidase [Alphaproteobacteria bacterium]|nr:M48 family metallopeptidase [Alphaproteobacteria bacterium]